jgi:hypothetical protein
MTKVAKKMSTYFQQNLLTIVYSTLLKYHSQEKKLSGMRIQWFKM